MGHHAYRPLREMLAEVFGRYGRPLLIAETGAENSAQSAWLHYVCEEVAAAARAGALIEGVCLYPILDCPGWENDRWCQVGLLSAADPSGRRRLRESFAGEIRRQREGLEESDCTSPVFHEESRRA